MPGKSVYSVDSDILISVLKNEPLPPGVREGVDDLFERAEAGTAVIVTSSVTLVEVLEGRMTEEARETFTSYFDRQTIVMVDADIKIMRLAGKIRDHHAQEIPSRVIKTPDAIHLATAIRYKAEVFYTLDEKLLKLTGKVLGESMPIETPLKLQMSLLDQPPPEIETANEATEVVVAGASEQPDTVAVASEEVQGNTNGHGMSVDDKGKVVATVPLASSHEEQSDPPTGVEPAT